mgnify:CR=1 FL=1
MKEIIKFHVALRREQFKIYGFWNITSLTFVILAIVFAVKYLQFRIGFYNLQALLITMFFYGVFGPLVYKKYDEEIRKENIYFSALGKMHVENYYAYRNIFIYSVLIAFLLIRFDYNGIGFFLFWILINQVLLSMELLWKRIPEQNYSYIRPCFFGVNH